MPQNPFCRRSDTLRGRKECRQIACACLLNYLVPVPREPWTEQEDMFDCLSRPTTIAKGAGAVGHLPAIQVVVRSDMLCPKECRDCAFRFEQALMDTVLPDIPLGAMSNRSQGSGL